MLVLLYICNRISLEFPFEMSCRVPIDVWRIAPIGFDGMRASRETRRTYTVRQTDRHTFAQVQKTFRHHRRAFYAYVCLLLHSPHPHTCQFPLFWCSCTSGFRFNRCSLHKLSRLPNASLAAGRSTRSCLYPFWHWVSDRRVLQGSTPPISQHTIIKS